jgi:glyoxylase-like metal-dependent hydrolase (beta-lactamase superfamily II)
MKPKGGLEMKITDDVTMLDCSSAVRVYLIQAQENVLVDTGLPGYGARILDELNRLGAADIRHIVITHCDIDHIGNARLLQQKTGAIVWASSDDIPFIMNEKRHPGFKGMSQIFFKTGAPASIQAFPDDMKIGEIHVIKAPGHTPGHVIFLYRDILFAGDLFAIRQGRFQVPPRLITWNQELVRQSIRETRSLSFTWICPAHGLPEQRGQEFERFASRF